MTSGSFSSVLLDSIIIDREGRQRRKLDNIEELAASLREIGLIHPPVLTRENVLVAGERRVTAARSLGWTSIPVQFTDELDELTLHLIELEENVKRSDLTWQEQTMAIEEFHTLKRKRDPEWNITKTAENLGVSISSVSKHIAVAKELSKPEIKEAPKFSTALGMVTRAAERKQRAATKDLDASIAAAVLPAGAPAPAPEPERPITLHVADFNKWADSYTGHPFNFLHCDFPYGINADKHNQGSAAGFGGYADSEDVYFALLSTLQRNMDRLVDPSAHMMFWFSMTFYRETIDVLEASGWKVLRTPLIWHRSDNKGILPDPQRGPRQVYETALLCSRGDRKIVRPVSNLCPASTTKEFHMSEKPAVMLEHFFRMLVDESTQMLDPTAGSGMSLKVAEKLGVARAVGLELNPEFAERARDNLGL